MIENLSTYMQSTVKNYKGHYVTLVHWYKQDTAKVRNKP